MDAPSRPGQSVVDPCPPWCRRTHATGDHPDDQHHQSSAQLVAVVAGNPVLEPDDQARPISAVLRLVRRRGSETTWVEVVSDEGSEVRLIVTSESARRLVRSLGHLLDGL
ncbi:MAG: hypothetical protein QM747_01890 [Nocardioides sp.]